MTQGMPSTSQRISRNHGLDTLRSAAIIFVFMYHYQVFVSHRATFGWASQIGWIGVDLFFVLSGYLIGNQIFAGLARGQTIFGAVVLPASRLAHFAELLVRARPAFSVSDRNGRQHTATVVEISDLHPELCASAGNRVFARSRQLKPHDIAPLALVVIVVIASRCGGWLLHRLVELPFLRLRDRLYPANFRDTSLQSMACASAENPA
jgi:peptidoglycan/LPS O-acetylase OafA/YrhL